jgi:ribose 5-phosphate isomerase B
LNKVFHTSLTRNKGFLLLLKTKKMKISIGNDHAGPAYKNEIVATLKSLGFEVFNHGTDTEQSVDYADFIHPVALDVSKGVADFGIIICGSGNGAAMTANKHRQIRAALCWNAEIASLARQHNDANILSIPARYVSILQAINMVETFINTDFEGGRHQARIEKIPCN